MNESVKPCQANGLRARKREATRSAITAAARILTAQNSLNGFTVEELCEEVGVSRRTFFNYFPTKEDAIIGHILDEFPAAALARFLAGPTGVPSAQQEPYPLSSTLLADLFTLTCSMVDQLSLTKTNISELLAAMEKEPQLMLKVMGSAPVREQEFSALIARREQLPPDDPRAHMVAALFGTCTRRAIEVFFSEENTASYNELLSGNLLAAQQIFTFSPLTFEGSR
ncbi:TetR/AcrR family transcriptional regulator [Arthrobacter sp. TMP15]|uniref:TetR/AcrR family transcriptional regulator n=1 Tax=Arthrobacter sp. TMP15 TaxID=3140789 RepID=UPI0031BA0C49